MSKWYKLDNAAKIYPAYVSRNDPGTFRIAAVLKEDLEESRLQAALVKTLAYFPSMAVTLRKGLFWYYLEENPDQPQVKLENKMPCSFMDLRETNGYLFQVVYYKKRVALECFHALTDGYGAGEFLKAILFNYFNDQVDHNRIDICLDARDSKFHEDSYKVYAGKDFSQANKQKAVHIKGTRTHMEGVYVHHGLMKAQDLKALAKTHQTSVTVFLLALYMKSLHAVTKKGPLVVTVPVNLRKLFPSITLRNFSYVMNISVDRDLDLDDMIDHIKGQFENQLQPAYLRGQFSKNVDYESSFFLKLTPLEVKNAILKTVRNMESKRIVTSIFTNPGLIRLPEDMKDKVSHFECILYASSPHVVNMGLVTYEDNLVLSLSRCIQEEDVIDSFFELLQAHMPSDITYYSNQGA